RRSRLQRLLGLASPSRLLGPLLRFCGYPAQFLLPVAGGYRRDYEGAPDMLHNLPATLKIRTNTPNREKADPGIPSRDNWRRKSTRSGPPPSRPHAIPSGIARRCALRASARWLREFRSPGCTPEQSDGWRKSALRL